MFNVFQADEFAFEDFEKAEINQIEQIWRKMVF